MTSIKQKLLDSDRSTKVSLVAFVDFSCIACAMYLSIVASNLEVIGLDIVSLLRLFWLPFFSVFIFYFLGVYRSVVRYINFSVIYVILKAISITFLINLILKTVLIYLSTSIDSIPNFNVNLITGLGWFVGLTTSTILVIGSRLIANYIFTAKNYANRIIIYGAGSAGIQLASALKVSQEMNPIAFVDKNRSLQGSYLAGIKILHPDKLETLVKKKKKTLTSQNQL